MNPLYLTRRRLTISILLGVLLAGALLIVPSAAYAQDGTPTGERATEVAAQTDEALAIYYIRLQLAVENQQMRIDASYNIINATRESLPHFAALGIDTAALEAATNSFEAEVARAQGSHDQGAAIVAAGSGFDGSGSVVDRQVAVTTVRDASDYLREAHNILTDATLDWRVVYRDFKDAIRAVLEG